MDGNEGTSSPTRQQTKSSAQVPVYLILQTRRPVKLPRWLSFDVSVVCGAPASADGDTSAPALPVHGSLPGSEHEFQRVARPKPTATPHGRLRSVFSWLMDGFISALRGSK